MGPDGATCFHTLNDKHRDIIKQKWDAERFGMLCTSTDSFKDLKKALEELCQNGGNCSFEQQQQVEKAKIFLDRVDATKKRVKK